ncbi:hypothetical protein ACOI1H_02435 [Loktanella sp. DJP18]|uniref:hypothetical protein n=1 Tax=Loktanella sp. DJP18 TaxID=3409788 RepID=UPI003BB8129B
MRQIVLATALALTAAPVAAQMADPPTEQQETPPGRDLIEEGAKLLFRGLLNEAEPTLRDLQDFADQVGPRMRELTDQMGPALADILALIDDIKNYSAPELLPNGDIIIRRTPEAPTYVPPEPGQEIEL